MKILKCSGGLVTFENVENMISESEDLVGQLGRFGQFLTNSEQTVLRLF